jgi:O-acetylhomoserine/O-acetylserine sulfhydrylase-like pyridoxal-dependent enzyme
MSATNFAVKHTADRIKLFSISANIENIKSLIIHPASIRCQRLSDAEQVVTGLTDSEDLKANLKV